MSANRMVYLSFAAILLLGVWLSGFERVHWLLYVPIVFASFAGLSGFCVNLWFWKKLGLAEKLQGGGCDRQGCR